MRLGVVCGHVVLNRALPSLAGTLAPALKDKMSGMAANDRIKVLVVLADRADIATLDPIHHVPFAMLQEVLGPLDVRPVPIPHDCSDGFLCAYWRRPQAYLEPRVRRSISTFSILPDPAPGLEALRRDLEDGTWERRNAELLTRDAMDWGYRVVVAGARPARAAVSSAGP